MRAIFHILFLSNLLFIATQCNPKFATPDQGVGATENVSPDTTNADDTLIGYWALQQVEGSNIVVREGTYMILSERTYFLYAGCNEFVGALHVRQDSMMFRQGMSTRVGCGGMEHEYESALSSLLYRVEKFSRNGKQLRLFAEKDIVLSFQKRTPADHLVEREFVVSGLTMYGGIERYNSDAPRQTLQFHPNGTLSGNSGCNNFKGVYHIVGDWLYISRIASTRRACADKKKRPYESFLYQQLQKSPLWINDSPRSITLSHPDSLGCCSVLMLDERRR